MAKGKNKYGLTEADIKHFKTRCECGSTACSCVFSWGSYYECHACKKQFGFTDGRGSSVSKTQFDSLAMRGKNRPAKSAGMSCPEEDEMAKAKKKVAKKTAVKKVANKGSEKKTERGPSVCAFVREYATKNQKATPEEIAKALDKKHPGISYSMATVKAQAYRARKGLDTSGKKK